MQKRLLLTASAALVLCCAMQASAETINIKGKEYEMERRIVRQIGPGTTYTRLRLPSYPLNVNMLQIDMNNPYTRIETMQGQELASKTESIVSAAKRYTTPGHKAIGGANGNFWCVSGQPPWSDLLTGITFGGNVRNSQIITETNGYADQWAGGPSNTGIICVDKDKNVYCEHMYWIGFVKNPKIGQPQIIQVNKVVREGEICMYNSFYGRDKKFMPVEMYSSGTSNHFRVVTTNDAIEVYLKFKDGAGWVVGQDMPCTVAKIVDNAGTGTLGDYDMALVARGLARNILQNLAEGDDVTILHGWVSLEDGKVPVIENLLEGVSVCMYNGVKIPAANTNSYNITTYPRTGYGTSADGRTMYVFTIDKSTDPVYGISAGSDTEVLCDIATHFGCVSICAMDGGGSTQMFVEDRVVNKTTESSPRAIANGFLVFSTAPEDNTITQLAFDDYELEVAAYSTSAPNIIGYNQYGDVVDHNVQGIEYSCAPELGTCQDGTFTAGPNTIKGMLTASLGDISVSKEVSVVSAPIELTLKPIYIDLKREYPIEITSHAANKTFVYEPSAAVYDIAVDDVCAIEDGVLKGLNAGTTTVKATIGDYNDETTIVVEPAIAPNIDINNWSEFTVSKPSGITDPQLSESGDLTFTYGAPRDAYIQVARATQIYGLPDYLELSFSTDIPLENVTLDLRTREHSRLNSVKITPEGDDTLFGVGEHNVKIPVSLVGDPDYLGTYPITFYYARFYMNKSSDYKGSHTIKLNHLRAVYSSYDSAQDIIASQIQPDADAPVLYYNMQGMRVAPQNMCPGIYIRRQGTRTDKVLIR